MELVGVAAIIDGQHDPPGALEEPPVQRAPQFRVIAGRRPQAGVTLGAPQAALNTRHLGRGGQVERGQFGGDASQDRAGPRSAP